MKYGVLGTGNVGQTLATRLVGLGHAVRLGSRTADNAAARAWAETQGERASHGTFADAASFSERVLNCTAGQHSVAVVAALAEALRGKILIDVANPLDFSEGFPPRLTVSNDDSLAEQVQRALPETRVVKTLNTMNADLMVEPQTLAGDHDVFVSGNDPDAKAAVVGLLQRFGWRDPIDLGDITTARGVEMFLALWVRLYGALGTARFQVNVVR